MRIVFVLAFSLCCFFSTFAQLQTAGNSRSYKIDGNSVVFDCDNAKVLLKVCSGSMLKVWYDPKGNFKRANESFAVINEDIDNAGKLQLEERPESYDIFTAQLRIRVDKAPFRIQVFDKYQKLLMGDHPQKGLQHDSSKLIANKTLRSDEQFFGLGEKAGPLNRRGRSYTMWNSDKPCYSPGEDPLYKSIPFFLSNYRYGVFFDNTYKTIFRFGTASEDHYSFEAPGGEMIYYFIHGADYKQIISQYIQLTGKPIMPPEWAFGFSQSRGMYTNEPLARSAAAEFRKRQIPCDIIYQDIGWTDGLQNFEWRKDRYTDPKGMLKYLDSLGFKMIVSQDPVISQATTKQWKEADSLGYFTTDIRTGKSYDMPWPWGGNCGVVDFTKPAVADWWGAYQQKPLNDGVRGFWTDMGEPAWSNEDATERLFMKHTAGMHNEIHNVYGHTWDKVVKEQFDKRNPGKRIFQMTRSAFAGLQRYTFGWSGDSGNGDDVLDGWSRLANQIPVGLSAGMGGIPFWATDISGYCGDIKDYPAMAELYTRWLQFGIFNPLSRAHHEGDNAVEPWLFGTEAEKNCRNAIELKYQLFPYIYTYAREAHDKGWPIMRALMLEYPNDQQTFSIDDQFLFGKELLVAPVVKKGAVTRKVYFPEGEWIDFYDGKTIHEGEQQETVKAPLNKVPLFVKKGSIIPMMPVMQYIHERRDYPLSLQIYPANEGQSASFLLYEDDGESTNYLKDEYSTTRFSCETQDRKYMVHISKPESKEYSVPGRRDYILKLFLPAKPSKVLAGGKALTVQPTNNFSASAGKVTKQLNWSWDPKTGICFVRIPASDKEVAVEIIK
ncbi:MAG: glycoside hydrolase family 31 protein [Chitinophagaceae bacterium]